MLGIIRAFFSFMHWHLFGHLPEPTRPFTDQVIIVTGSNTGLGLEAARHLVRLNAARVILAVRNTAKGEAARASIEQSTGRTGVVEVWELDLARYASVRAFAARAARELPRLDAVVANAALLTQRFAVAEDNEATITVNVVSTFLLALLLLPQLRESSERLGRPAVLTFTGSFVHWITPFPERKAKFILEETARRDRARMLDRYHVSKMMELLAFRELAGKVSKSSKPGKVTVSLLNPGIVKTELNREAGAGITGAPRMLVVNFLGRSVEEGSRTLVHAAEGAPETHGQYLDNCQISEVSDWVRSKEGGETQRRLWDELIAKLESIEPGISDNI